MENKFKLKKFLATASAFAMITGASSAAMGDVIVTGGAEDLTNAGTWVGANTPPVNNDSIQLGGNHTLDANAADRIISAYDINGKNAGLITISENLSLGSVGNVNGGAAADIKFGAAKVLTLSGTAGGAIGADDYSGLGDIDFNNTASTINAVDGVDFGGAIDSAAGGPNGTLNFAGNGSVNGAIGANNALALVSFNGAGTVQLKAASKATTFKVNHADAIAQFDHNITGDVSYTADGTVNVADNKTITGKLDNAGPNTGVLNFAGRGAVTAKVGHTNALKEVNINGTTAAGVVAFADEVKAQKITVNDAAAKVTFANNVTAANGLQFSKDGQVTVAAGNKVITGAVKNTVAAGVDGKFANTGKLIFTAGSGAGVADGTVTGAIGEDGKALSLVHIVGAGDVSLTAANTAHHAATFKFDDADSRLLVAAGGSLVGDLVAVANNDGKIRFAGAGEITGKIGDTGGNGVGLVEANGAAVVKIGAGDHKAAFATKDAGAGFTFADGANVTGAITNTSLAAHTGALTFEGKSTVNGVVGGGANKMNVIDVTGGADKNVIFKLATTATTLNIGKNDQEGAAKVTIGNALTVTDILFLDNKTQSGELEISGAGGHVITGGINSAAGAADETRGKITIAANVGANAVTFAGKIGDTANKKGINHLHILNNDAGGSVILQGGTDVHIAKVQAAGAGTLKLNEADAKFKFGEIVLDNDNVFSLAVNENAVLKGLAEGSVNFGTATHRLKSLEFTDDKTLTIENGVNIYAGELNNTVGNNNKGTLIFKGDSIFSAKSDGQNINAIEVQGNGNTVTILKDIHTENDIKLSNNATLAVAGSITADTANGNDNDGNGVVGVADNNGKLKFINSAAVTVDGRVGAAAAKLQSIEFNGGDVTFNNVVRHDGRDLLFTGTNASKVTFDAAGIGAANFVNNSEANGVAHTVVLNTNEAFTGQIAVANPDTKQIRLDIGTNSKTATLNGGVQANGAHFINGNAADDKGTLDLGQDGVTVYGAGTAEKKLLAVNVNENATITGGTHAATTTIAQDKTATLGGGISGTNFALANTGSTAKFSDGATLKVAIADTVGDKGIVEFLGGGTVEAGKDIGTLAQRVKMVTFSDVAGKTLTFGSSVFANEKIDIRKGTFKPGNDDVVLNAPDVNAQNASFDLGSTGKVTVNNGNLTFSGTEGKIAVAIAQAGNNVSGGQIVAGTGATLKYDANSMVTITADDANGSRPSAGASRTFTLIKNDTGKAVVGTLGVNPVASTNPFTKWSSSFDNGNLILTQIDGAADKIKEILGTDLDAVDKANVDVLTQAEAGTDAAKFVTVLEGLVNNKAKMNEALDRLTSVSTATDSIENTMNDLVNGIGTRLSLVGKQTAGTPVQSRTVASANVTGVSAGDEHARYGAWFSPFFSKTTQKARKGAAGYKDTTYGGSFGMDTRANDDLILGAAVTFANSEMKHRDFKSGDKTKVNSLMFSIYALQQITDTWFAQGSATIASNEVKNSEKRVRNATAFDTVSGKYNSMSFVGDVLFGYNYATEDFTLTPMGGVRYARVNSAGYKENGSTTGQNLNVSQKASNKFEVVVGARVSGGTFDMNGMSVTPELHGFINHDVIGKNPKQDLRIGGAPTSLTAKSRKPIKTTFNLGLGVNADYGMMEYGVGYDVHLAEKRVGHEGSLKVRVNF